jgi:hypothetical protein
VTKKLSKKSAKPVHNKVTALSRRAPAEPKGSPKINESNVGPLCERIANILENARARVVRVVNSEMILAYWHIGREIVEYLQKGAARADYGEQLLEVLSVRLGQQFGRGYSSTNLRYLRLFYQLYADREPKIRHKACDELEGQPKKHHKPCDVSSAMLIAVGGSRQLEGFSAALSWSHYRTLTKVEHAGARAFYEIEAEQEGWSVPALEHQIQTQLFLRLTKSRDKAGVMELASRGQVLERLLEQDRGTTVKTARTARTAKRGKR